MYFLGLVACTLDNGKHKELESQRNENVERSNKPFTFFRSVKGINENREERVDALSYLAPAHYSKCLINKSSSIVPKKPVVESFTSWPSNQMSSLSHGAVDVSALLDQPIYKLKLYKNNTSVYKSPIVNHDANMLYVINDVGKLTSYDIHTGKEVWSYKFIEKSLRSNADMAEMLYSNGRLYVTSGGDVVMAMDALNGSIIWSQKLSKIIRSVPVLNGETLLLQSGDDVVYALDAKTGDIIWVKLEMGYEGVAYTHSVAPFVYENKHLITYYKSGEAVSMDIKTGNEIWRHNVSSSSDEFCKSPSCGHESGIMHHHNTLYIYDKGMLFALNLRDGNILWSSSCIARSDILLSRGFLYGFSKTAKGWSLIAIDAQNGNAVWSRVIPMKKSRSSNIDQIKLIRPIISQQGQVVVIVGDGSLYKFDFEDGLEVPAYHPTKIASYPAFFHDFIFTILQSGELAVFKN